MIQISKETILSLRQAAKLFPPARQGKPVSFQCVLRWVLNGARGPDGELVRLESLRIGSRWVTSREAIQRFAEALTPEIATPAPARTRRQRLRAAAKAEHELDRMGI
jgi:hypothetical protein